MSDDITSDNYAECFNCGKMNKKQQDGYYMCDCKGYGGSSVLFYLPKSIYLWRKNKNYKLNKLKSFLDSEEQQELGL